MRIKANDRQGLERLLRYCARPAFAQERLRQIDAEHLVYESPKPGPGGRVSQILTPLELMDRLAALIPPPRRHRHRYYGVLAPNSPLRSAVTALAVYAGAAYLLTWLIPIFDWPDWLYRLSVFDAFGHPYQEWPGTAGLLVLVVMAAGGTALAALVTDRRPKVASG